MHDNDTTLCESKLYDCKEICFIKEIVLKKVGWSTKSCWVFVQAAVRALILTFDVLSCVLLLHHHRPVCVCRDK